MSVKHRNVTEALTLVNDIHSKLVMTAPGDPAYPLALELEPKAKEAVAILRDIDARTASDEPRVVARRKKGHGKA